jgi:uncharacterized membrane protein
MAFCGKCGAQLAEGVTFCGSCGTPVGSATGGAPAPAPGATASSGLAPNVAGALAYVTIIPAILFLVMEPYNKDKFIRFHSFQSLFFGVAWIVLWIAMVIVSMVLAVIPVVGWIIDFLLYLAIGLGGLVLWIVLLYKAYNNQKWEVPVIGKLALQQAG